MEDFKKAKIFSQEWMTENLNVDTYRNGESILYAENPKQWASFNQQNKGCYCYFKYDSKKGKRFGKLYNGYAVLDARGLAPSGFQVASGVDLVKMVENSGGKYAINNQPSKGFDFTSSDFGCVDEFGEMSKKSYSFWSSNINPESEESAFVLGISKNYLEFSFDYLRMGYYVRCLQDGSSYSINQVTEPFKDEIAEAALKKKWEKMNEESETIIMYFEK